MKKFLFLFLLCSFTMSYAQELKSPIETSIVDKTPEFPGGYDEFRKLVLNNFDTKLVEAEGIVRTRLIFVIEKDGTISDIEATGSNVQMNNAAIEAVKKVTQLWIPAERKGEKVRYHFSLPIAMSFE